MSCAGVVPNHLTRHVESGDTAQCGGYFENTKLGSIPACLSKGFYLTAPGYRISSRVMIRDRPGKITHECGGANGIEGQSRRRMTYTGPRTGGSGTTPSVTLARISPSLDGTIQFKDCRMIGLARD
jgi:hypothetical protein